MVSWPGNHSVNPHWWQFLYILCGYWLKYWAPSGKGREIYFDRASSLPLTICWSRKKLERTLPPKEARITVNQKRSIGLGVTGILKGDRIQGTDCKSFSIYGLADLLADPSLSRVICSALEATALWTRYPHHMTKAYWDRVGSVQSGSTIKVDRVTVSLRIQNGNFKKLSSKVQDVSEG